jgi:flagellar hook-basal body complex protein FliE
MTLGIDGYGKAIAAYARAAGGEQAPDAPAAGGSGGSFAEMLKGAMEETLASGKAAEKASVAAVGSGGADLTGVVTAVAEAETTLQTAIAVRDRVIEAYKDILRMSM